MARTCRQRVSIAHLAGVVPERPVDGRSVVPLLMGMTPDNWRTRFLVEHWFEGSEVDVPTYAAVRTGSGDALPHRLYVEYYGDPEGLEPATDVELYDFAVRVDQTESLHAEPGRAEERAALSEATAGLRTCGMIGRPSCQSLER
jgi:hypothetical protein